ncbi:MULTISPECIES: hypothetical protein [unclassified Sphingomonas]|uniref:hypothetical protein n=1 Tax=unclassified Sphingomonas TaxID=196159 RepID=UPI000A973B70|nr:MULTISPECIES: hypothetical protein [unclassified Sphingomonas]
MIRGAVDGFTYSSGRYSISGWAFETRDGERFPVDDLQVQGIEAVEIVRHVRGDVHETIDFGFRIFFMEEADALSAAFGNAKVVATGVLDTQSLSVWDKLVAQVVSVVINNRSADFDANQRAKLIGALLDPVRKVSHTVDREVVALPVEVGTLAFDHSTVIGRDAYLFLSGGSNNLGRLYQTNDCSDLGMAWSELIDRRAETLQSMGCKYLQCIVPEKQSVLGRLHPENISGPTPILQLINKTHAWKSMYLDVYRLFDDLYREKGLSPFRKVDTHLNFFGVETLADAILRWVKPGVDSIGRPVLKPQLSPGDLGNKFAVGEIVETLEYPVLESWEFARRDVSLISEHSPEEGHTGSIRHWTNADSLLNEKIVIFGNSIFERGGGPLTLSWWMARIFRETIFIWSSSIDFGLVEKIKPDVVICQTVERFIGTVPGR